MNDFSSGLRVSTPAVGRVIHASKPLRFMALALFVAAIATVACPKKSFANSQTASTSASARIDFRIVIPAIIRVTTVTQPDSIQIDAKHIENGYIDLDAATAVKLTNNTRGGYQLTVRYDSALLSGVEVLVASRKLSSSSGFGSMHVASERVTEQLVPIGYRLYLSPGARAGQYRWPVALAFSLALA